jgi:hypothetical protein
MLDRVGSYTSDLPADIVIRDQEHGFLPLWPRTERLVNVLQLPLSLGNVMARMITRLDVRAVLAQQKRANVSESQQNSGNKQQKNTQNATKSFLGPETPDNTQRSSKMTQRKAQPNTPENAEESSPDPAERRQITLCRLVVEGCLAPKVLEVAGHTSHVPVNELAC